MINTLEYSGSWTCCLMQVQKSLDPIAQMTPSQEQHTHSASFPPFRKVQWAVVLVLLAIPTRFFHLHGVFASSSLCKMHRHSSFSYRLYGSAYVSYVTQSSAYACATSIKPAPLS